MLDVPAVTELHGLDRGVEKPQAEEPLRIGRIDAMYGRPRPCELVLDVARADGLVTIPSRSTSPRPCRARNETRGRVEPTHGLVRVDDPEHVHIRDHAL